MKISRCAFAHIKNPHIQKKEKIFIENADSSLILKRPGITILSIEIQTSAKWN